MQCAKNVHNMFQIFNHNFIDVWLDSSVATLITKLGNVKNQQYFPSNPCFRPGLVHSWINSCSSAHVQTRVWNRCLNMYIATECNVVQARVQITLCKFKHSKQGLIGCKNLREHLTHVAPWRLSQSIKSIWVLVGFLFFSFENSGLKFLAWIKETLAYVNCARM